MQVFVKLSIEGEEVHWPDDLRKIMGGVAKRLLKEGAISQSTLNYFFHRNDDGSTINDDVASLRWVQYKGGFGFIMPAEDWPTIRGDLGEFAMGINGLNISRQAMPIAFYRSDNPICFEVPRYVFSSTVKKRYADDEKGLHKEIVARAIRDLHHEISFWGLDGEGLLTELPNPYIKVLSVNEACAPIWDIENDPNKHVYHMPSAHLQFYWPAVLKGFFQIGRLRSKGYGRIVHAHNKTEVA